MMTHGDAVIILRLKTATLEQKYEALDLIFNNELKYDYNCLNKTDLWNLTKFLYQEINRRQIIGKDNSGDT